MEAVVGWISAAHPPVGSPQAHCVECRFRGCAAWTDLHRPTPFAV